MRTKIKVARNLFLAAGVLMALAFGATEAFAGPQCSEGVPPDSC